MRSRLKNQRVCAAREDINKSQAGHSPCVDLIASTGKNSSDAANTFNLETAVDRLDS